jgi:hypothetical protein
LRRTNTYNLAYPEPGANYIGELDKQDFLTLEYNLDTYIGITGNGVIKGWDISVISGLLVKVNPGSGIIGGKYSETPYYLDLSTGEPKKKSVAIADGDVIVEEIPGWSSPDGNNWNGMFYSPGGSPTSSAMVFKQLGPDGEDSNYDGVVDGVYAPSFQQPPTDYLTDPWVKAAPMSMIGLVLRDNSDNYIMATRMSSDPSQTFVSFSSAGADISSTSSVLLAKVTTRNGVVAKINYKSVKYLADFKAAAELYGRGLITYHRHGGNLAYDPPKIQLTTDVRDAVISDYDYASSVATLRVLPTSMLTDVVEDHKHTYEIDGSGNGYTESVMGDVPIHYHRIVGWVISDMTAGYQSSIKDHIHVVATTTDSLTA